MEIKHRTLAFVLLVVVAMAMGMAGCTRRPKSDTGGAAVAGRGTPGASPGVPAPPQTGHPAVDRSQWPVIVAFGDSLTSGQGVPFDRSYPSQLQERLDELGYRYRVVNAGISGDTAAGGLNRIETVLRHKPLIVIVQLGANDGLRGQPVGQMRDNLAAIIERLHREQVQVILAGMQIPPNLGPEYTSDFRQVFHDLAAEYHIPLIPFFLDGVAARRELNQGDGIHPTAEGYEYVVQNVLPVLMPLLSK